MSCFRDSVGVARGAYIDSGRSGTDAVKRMIKYISCSGRAMVFVMMPLDRRLPRSMTVFVCALLHGGLTNAFWSLS